MSAPHPDAEQLTLAALPAEQADPEVAAHLLECAQCRAEVDELRRTVELARADGVGEPLPIPPTRVWQAILDELAEDPAAAGTPDRDGHSPRRAAGRRRPRGARPAGDSGPRRRDGAAPPARPVVAALARRRRGGRGRRPRARGRHRRRVSAAPGTSPSRPRSSSSAPSGIADPAATGTAAMVDHDGDQRMVVELRGVTNLAGGDYLEAWLMDSTGSRLLPLGALARHGEEFRGEFTIPAGLPAGEFSRVDVSAERFDGDPGHSTVSLLRGDLA